MLAVLEAVVVLVEEEVALEVLLHRHRCRCHSFCFKEPMTGSAPILSTNSFFDLSNIFVFEQVMGLYNTRREKKLQ